MDYFASHGFSHEWDHTAYAVCVWLFSLRFIRIVEGFSAMIFRVLFSGTALRNTSLFIPSPLDEHLVWSQFLLCLILDC